MRIFTSRALAVLHSGPERLPPGTVVHVPGDGGLDGLLEGAARGPPEGRDLVGRDRVAAVVALAVLDVVDARFVLAERREDDVGDLTVGALVAGADVVDLADLALA